MFLLNGLEVRISDQHTIGDTQYPRGWFVDPENRAAVGIVEVPDPEVPDHRLFEYEKNPDGSYTTRPVIGALERIKKDTLLHIDTESDGLLVQLVGARALEYYEVEKEVRAYADSGYASAAVPEVVASWAAIKFPSSTTLYRDAADDILRAAEATKTKQADVRKQRLSYKEKVRKTPDIAGLDEILVDWNSWTQAFRESITG